MPMDYSRRLQNISERYNPDKSTLIEQRMYSTERSYDEEVAKYVLRAMCAVDEEYTKKTKEAGEAAKQHLSAQLSKVSFEYQGSVMTDTHIRGASDIDLLVVCEKFYGTDIIKVREELQQSWKYDYVQQGRLQRFHSSFSLYQGDSLRDLRELRSSIESIMSSKYSICDVSKPKSVKITNQHLHRDVDVVISSWFQSLDYVLNGMPQEKRGVKIYNKDMDYEEAVDYPFLSISRINSRSACTQGRLKRMIRFLKNVRTDSEKDILLNSFDINAICYSIPICEYESLGYKELVNLLWRKMYHLWTNGTCDNLVSVVGDEYVFKGKPEKVQALKELEDEVYKINQDLNK